MSVKAFCTGCGQRQDVPAGYSKAKFRCAECGVIFELPPDIRELARNAPAVEEKPAPTARTKPRVKQTEADAAADMLQSAEQVQKPKPTGAASPKAKELEAPAPAVTRKAEQPAASSPVPKQGKPSSPSSAAKGAKETPPAHTPLEDADIVPADEEGEPIIAEEEEPEREVLIEGTEEDDRNPYRVTGDVKTRRCPECSKPIDYRENFCVHCGFNLSTGEKKKRSFQPLSLVWENGWPFQKRLTAFFVCQAVNLVMVIGLAIVSDYTVSFVMLFMQVGLQAFLLGTFDTLKLARNSKGKVTITKTWRYAFIPQKPQTIRWKDHEGLVIIQSNEPDMFSWGMMFILLGYGCVPGILFWYFVIRPDKWDVSLALAHGSADVTLYHGLNEARAREMHAAISDATGLKDNR
jgi:predicted nucleic acid-binding Zn ribbon protein